MNGYRSGDIRERTKRARTIGLLRLMRRRSVKERRVPRDRATAEERERKRSGGTSECRERTSEKHERMGNGNCVDLCRYVSHDTGIAGVWRIFCLAFRSTAGWEGKASDSSE